MFKLPNWLTFQRVHILKFIGIAEDTSLLTQNLVQFLQQINVKKHSLFRKQGFMSVLEGKILKSLILELQEQNLKLGQ